MSAAALILSEMAHGMWQRRDGLRCAPGVLYLPNWRFSFALWLLIRMGVIEKRKRDSPLGSGKLPYFRMTWRPRP